MIKSALALVLFQAVASRSNPDNGVAQAPFAPLSYVPPAALPLSPPAAPPPAIFSANSKEPQSWLSKYGKQSDLGYTGPLAFSHLEYARCLEDTSVNYDVAILGMPFDTATSFRPGARFGPHGIRIGSRRQHGQRAYSLAWGMDPFKEIKVMDCGDIPLSAYDNMLALDQMEVAYDTLLARPVAKAGGADLVPTNPVLAMDGAVHPKIITLGGDHTIVLPILRSLYKVYGPVSVIHFDAHLDTWGSLPVPGAPKDSVTHGSFFYVAHEEGLLLNDTSIHAGIRCKMISEADIENDEEVGFTIVSAEDVDDLGIPEVIKRIRQRVGDTPVYLTLDIDVVDPGIAPATGTPEIGGLTTREVKRIIRGLSGLNFVGADVVEVAPAYDNADITNIAAADIIHDFLGMMVSPEPPLPRDERKKLKAKAEL